MLAGALGDIVWSCMSEVAFLVCQEKRGVVIIAWFSVIGVLAGALGDIVWSCMSGVAFLVCQEKRGVVIKKWCSVIGVLAGALENIVRWSMSGKWQKRGQFLRGKSCSDDVCRIYKFSAFASTANKRSMLFSPVCKPYMKTGIPCIHTQQTV